MNGRGSGNGQPRSYGIPFGLNMYENLPFWFTLFTRLNFEVVLSPESSRDIYLKGQHTIPSDTVCYPAKLLHGHVEALADACVDAIWYPCMSYNNDEGIGDNHYNCPVVAYYPELLAANVPSLKNTKFLDPYVGLWRHKDCEKRLAALGLKQSFKFPERKPKLPFRLPIAPTTPISKISVQPASNSFKKHERRGIPLSSWRAALITLIRKSAMVSMT